MHADQRSIREAGSKLSVAAAAGNPAPLLITFPMARALEDFLRAAASSAGGSSAHNRGLGWGEQVLSGPQHNILQSEDHSGVQSPSSTFDWLKAAVNSVDCETLTTHETEIKAFLDANSLNQTKIVQRLSMPRVWRILDMSEEALSRPVEAILRFSFDAAFGGCAHPADAGGPPPSQHLGEVPRPRQPPLAHTWPELDPALGGAGRPSSISAQPPTPALASPAGLDPADLTSVFQAQGPAQGLQLLQCALALSGGKQEALGEYLEHLDSNNLTYSVQGLIQKARLGTPCGPYAKPKWVSMCEAAKKANLWCPPYLENIPGLEINRRWTPGRVIAEWLEEWSRFSLGAWWHRLASVMDLQNHARKVCAIAADRGRKKPEEAERTAMRYDHVVREKLWDKYRNNPDQRYVSLYFAGEVDGLIGEAERLARADDAPAGAPSGRMVASREERFCLKHALAKGCRGFPDCAMQHLCPFCGSRESGCLVQHIAKAGFAPSGKGKGKTASSQSWVAAPAPWRPRREWSVKEEDRERDRRRTRSRSRHQRGASPVAAKDERPSRY